ncbi:hypothetical protein CP532_6294 [Ophiocordyceps camponoti-leonardi (nom. inval.)]|nr:hypothetical protein CP532_6294 [Ophiocordyceps camponoti-leonardi (nom. inval.)]
MENIGSTSIIEPVWPGVVLKQPINFKTQELAEKVDLCFSVEPLILERIGRHPRIVGYLGQRGRGLLLGQASHGNLQAYLDSNPSIDLRQRILWCRQVAEAVSYIHSRGVVHSDLRPRNILVHQSATSNSSRDLWLCDFGGSTCDELALDGGCLPDGPFYHPVFGVESSPALDIFGLGSLFYTVITGRWPYRSDPGAPRTIDEKLAYEKDIADAFNREEYPDLKDVVGGTVILACWKRRYGTAEEVLRALEREMPISAVQIEATADLEGEAGHASAHVLFGTALSVVAFAALTYILIQRRHVR